MKILLVTHYYPEHRSGIEIVAYRLAKQLIQNNDINIEWVASDTDLPPQNIPNLIYFPMKTSNFMEKSFGLPYPFWSLNSIFELYKAVKRADVIHLHDYLYMGNLLAFLFAKIHGKPVLISQHIGYIPYKNILLKIFLHTMNKTLGIFILSHANQTVFASNSVKDYYFSNNLLEKSKSPLIIPTGVDHNFYRPVTSEKKLQIQKELGFPANSLLFLFVGRFVEKKGLPIIQELASKFKSVQWAIVGWGPINPEKWDLPNTKIYRNFRYRELLPLYQAADLLVLPSKGEGFPLVVQEAMACGTPVIVGTETSMVFNNLNNLGFSADVETKDATKKWVSKIKYIIENKSLLYELRKKVAEFASKSWRWEECANEYKNIFYKITHKQK